MGNITRDIELRATPKGTSVADIGLACNRVRMGDDGQKIEEVTFVDVTLWGRTAETASQYLSKGRPVLIEGRLHMDSWTDKETGKQRTKLKVVGEQMHFVDSAPNSGGGNNNNGGQQQRQQQNQPMQNSPQQSQPQQQQQAPPQGGSPASNMPDFQDEDDDIPF